MITPLRQCCCLLAFSAAMAAFASLRLPAIIGSHMVLQQRVPLPVWGRAEAGERVSVRLAGQTARTTADAQGAWRVTFKPLEARPRQPALSMTITGAHETIILTDILVGEVWLCAGQSNMEMATLSAARGREEVRAAHDPQLRLFQVGRHTAATPQWGGDGVWRPAMPEVVDDFSAAGYFFARTLRTKLGVPIGIMQATWGGSVVEGWLPREVLAGAPHFAGRIAELDRRTAAYTPQVAERRLTAYQQELPAARAREAQYWETVGTKDPGIAGQWAQPALDDHDWPLLELPGIWENAGIPTLADFDGFVWFRRQVTIPPAWVGQALTLELPPLDDSDSTYVNNTLVGRTTGNWTDPRAYPIPASVVTGSTVTIAVQVLDMAFAGGFAGSARTFRLYRTDHPEDTPLTLAGPWRYRISTPAKELPWPSGLPATPVAPGAEINAPASFYNGMIAPLLPFALRGIVWYQGESNTPNAGEYPELLTLLIASWRSAFVNRFAPFGIVQLPGYQAPTPDAPVLKSDWAAIREAERQVAERQPHVGLAVTLDLGEAQNIHPFRKQEVGQRLAQWAAVEVYRQSGEASGPLVSRLTRHGAEVAIRFAHARYGLMTRDGLPPAGFALAGRDGIFVWATAHVAGDTLYLSAPTVPMPTSVAYAWADNPTWANLVNRAGLLASPFRLAVP